MGHTTHIAYQTQRSSSYCTSSDLKDDIKYAVTDTSWWLEYGWYDALDAARRNPSLFFVIPRGVMRELDGLKRDRRRGKRALESTKQIAELLRIGKGKIEMGNGGYGVLSSRVDEEVVSVAEKYRNLGRKVEILTTDFAQRALAISRGVRNETERIQNRRSVVEEEASKSPLGLFVIGGTATILGLMIEPWLGGLFAFLTVWALLKLRPKDF